MKSHLQPHISENKNSSWSQHSVNYRWERLKYFGQSQSPFFISTSSRPTRLFGGGGGCFTLGGNFLITGGGRLGSIGTALSLAISCINFRTTVFTDFSLRSGLFSTVPFIWSIQHRDIIPPYEVLEQLLHASKSCDKKYLLHQYFACFVWGRHTCWKRLPWYAGMWILIGHTIPIYCLPAHSSCFPYFCTLYLVFWHKLVTPNYLCCSWSFMRIMSQGCYYLSFVPASITGLTRS